MVRSELAYYVPLTLNRTVPAYRTSVQFLKDIKPTYRTSTITKKADRTCVPYFLEKNCAVPYLRTVPYCHPCFSLHATLTDFEITNL